MAVPAQPKLYHITHVRHNLPAILGGGLRSDAAMMAAGGPTATIGMSSIKQRRLTLPVRCNAGDDVGGYVPFYFCPRSIMLFLIHCANHPELTYRAARGLSCIWKRICRKSWPGRRDKASAGHSACPTPGRIPTEFRNRLEQLDEVDSAAVAATDFREAQVKEGKQAEFMVREFFPLATGAPHRRHRCACLWAGARRERSHRPAVEARREWYF